MISLFGSSGRSRYMCAGTILSCLDVLAFEKFQKLFISLNIGKLVFQSHVQLRDVSEPRHQGHLHLKCWWAPSRILDRPLDRVHVTTRETVRYNIYSLAGINSGLSEPQKQHVNGMHVWIGQLGMYWEESRINDRHDIVRSAVWLLGRSILDSNLGQFIHTLLPRRIPWQRMHV